KEWSIKDVVICCWAPTTTKQACSNLLLGTNPHGKEPQPQQIHMQLQQGVEQQGTSCSKVEQQGTSKEVSSKVAARK
ncbi:hypothetical protein ACTGZQ_11490, partial [Streptococcus suis]